MNYYQFHVGDFSSHTSHLYPMEELAYRRMLDQYYLSESPLPVDPERVARLIGMRDQVAMVAEILSEFFLKSDAGWTNKRADEEIAKYQAKASRANAANSARWSEKKSNTDLKSERIQLPTNNQEPLTNKPYIKRRKVADAPLVFPNSLNDESFIQVWNAYLEYRKAGKMKSLQQKSQQLLLTQMSVWGKDKAIAALNTTMSNGWTGVFEPKAAGAIQTQTPNKYSGIF